MSSNVIDVGGVKQWVDQRPNKLLAVSSQFIIKFSLQIQLVTTKIQLVATEIQLVATEIQLVATKIQLAATKIQLVATEIQLVATGCIQGY